MSTRALIGIISCNKPEYKLRAQSQRETWIPLAQEFFTVRTFVGGGDELSEYCNTITLPVKDTYEALPFKVQSAVRWALRNGFTQFFKCDDDCYVNAQQLLRCAAEAVGFDLVGRFRAKTGNWPADYPSGGGYWLSQRAMEIVATAVVDDDMEDRWVGNKCAHLYRATDPLAYRHLGTSTSFNLFKPPSVVGYSAAVCEFNPSEMRECHKNFLRWKTDYYRQTRKPRMTLTAVCT